MTTALAITIFALVALGDPLPPVFPVPEPVTPVTPKPKPDEPMLIGAVIQDRAGATYVRVGVTALNLPWMRLGDRIDRRWSQIDVVRVLSPGYDAEATS